jgi:chromate reductase, NAD(P)H dehydrogenase (quinone)
VSLEFKDKIRSKPIRMITIISGTNRVDNNSLKIAMHVKKVLDESGEQNQILNLQELPVSIMDCSRHAKYDHAPDFLALQEKYMFPATKFIFVLPEYNGSIPGILKLLIDTCDIKRSFYFKKACLFGLASGRAGNLRGLDHLTNILNYLKMDVYFHKTPISGIEKELDENGALIREGTIKTIRQQIEGFIQY